MERLQRMLPEILSQHWNHLQTQVADHCERFGLNWSSLWNTLPLHQQEKLLRVLTLSEYVAENFVRDDKYICECLTSEALDSPVNRDDFERWLDELSRDAISEDDWHKALRQMRRRAMIHIIWRDALKIAHTLETTRALSELADVCVNRSIAFLLPDLEQRHGKPLSKETQEEQHLIVIGMGKLGGWELNLSSDIDLIFAYHDSGNTTGPKVISNQEFFIKLGQKLILALDKHTIDGFVFRTDMRLRPYGQSGPLVMNYASLEEYYQNQGRDWERYAMVKARLMTGEDTPAAQELIALLRAFTYRVYIDYSAFESLRSMKAMINAEVRRRGLEQNVKLGPGGIREIEFIVQAFQLIRGGQEKHLQSRELVEVLDMLAADGYLPTSATTELKAAYFFLRDSEHAIQAVRDEQTQQLPDDELTQARIAHSMRCSDWSNYLTQLNQYRSIVSHHFSHIVAHDDEQQDPETEHEWLDLWHGELHDAAEAEFLQQHPCAGEENVRAIIDRFRESRAVNLMQQVGRERLETLMPRLLKEVWQQDNSAETLSRIIPLLEAVLRRTAYLVLLSENPQALHQLVRLCAASSWVAEYITRTPLLLDELLVPETLFRLPDSAELKEELHLRLLRIEADDLEQQMEQLRQYVRAHKLRAAACEVMGKLTLMQVSDYLTRLAETTLDMVTHLAFEQMVAKYGYPTNADKEAIYSPEFLIVGYGKVGGLELSYSSDLDVVFIHNAHAGRATTGDRALDNSVFYTRMGQRMVHICTAQTRSGDLYEIDLRLRPSGSSGMIVASMNAFKEYQAKHAWTWEHQALVRARIICGPSDLGQQFQTIRNDILQQARDPQTLREEVRAMRQKMRDNLGSKDTSGQQFHLKQDAGGIVDIEFLVQYGVLAWSHQHPALLQVTDNMRLLDAFADVGLMAPQDCQTLQEIYLSYRAETHRRALQQQPLLLDSDTVSALGFNALRNDVTQQWKLWLETEATQPPEH
jgi:glutamate-ammonia-ligase adenylyltransferase